MTTGVRSLFMLLAFGLAVSAVDSMALEYNYDRPGGEYVAHYENVNSPDVCMNICRNNPACVAFTWVKPGIQKPSGVCWLKGSLSSKVYSECCVSGVVKNVQPDFCKWFMEGAYTYSCKCKNSATGKWYQANPPACKDPKPPPGFVDPNNRPPVLPGQGVFGQ